MWSARPTWCPHHRLIQVHQQSWSMFSPSLPLKSYHLQTVRCNHWFSGVNLAVSFGEGMLSPFPGCWLFTTRFFFTFFGSGIPYRPSFATIYWEEGRQPNLTCKKSCFYSDFFVESSFFRCESGIKTRTSCCWRLNQFLMFPFLQGLVGWSVGASCWMSQWKNLPTGTAPPFGGKKTWHEATKTHSHKWFFIPNLLDEGRT